MQTRALLALTLCSLAATAPASELPPLGFPNGVGVNIHFTRGHARDLDLIAAAGFKFIRMDFGWGSIERRKGEYDWAAYDELTRDLDQRGLRAVYILDYSNGLYEDTITSANPINGQQHRDTASPRKPESVAAYARWAAAAAARFKGRHVVWEIWNEPNIGFWKPKPNAQDYATLVLATCKAMRAADSDATIMGPASSEFPWPFFETLFKAGALQYLDAVSVHPYRNYSRGPETAAEDYFRLRSMIERYAPAAKRGMPIVSGEWGYATQTKGGVSLETQAAFIARQQIANEWQGVPISIWYDWKNDGEDASYGEHNFGTVSNNLAVKPSYVAVQTMTRELNGYRVVRRLDVGTNDDFVFLLVNNRGEQKLAAWTSGKPHAISLPAGLSAQDVSITSGQGQPVPPQAAGELTLELQAAPQYVTIKKPGAVLKSAAAWSIDGFVPTLVDAGTGELRVPVTVSNCFADPVAVTVDIGAKDLTASQRMDLRAGESMTETISVRPRLRTAEKTPYTIRVSFQQGGRALGTSVEKRAFEVSNPLMVSAAPVAEGVRLAVQSPHGAPFKGVATVNGREVPVQVGGTMTEQVLTVPAESKAGGTTLRVELKDTAKTVVAEPLVMRLDPLPVKDLKRALDGDAKVAATAAITKTSAPAGAMSFPGTFKVDYSFDAGWKFLRLTAAGDRPIDLGTGTILGMWVYGDGSGNSLRTRVTDTAGQTFQPTGPSLEWTGWRWVEFDLKNLAHAGHWGGANDGVARGNLTLDTLLLVDGPRKKTAGTIYVAMPTLLTK